MQKIKKHRSFKSIVEICLWTIRHHDLIVSSLRVYMFAATITILIVALTGSVHTRAACMAIIVGCFSIGLLIWIFSEVRKAVLLGIDEPELKAKAHRIMLAFMESHDINIDRQPGIWGGLPETGAPKASE